MDIKLNADIEEFIKGLPPEYEVWNKEAQHTDYNYMNVYAVMDGSSSYYSIHVYKGKIGHYQLYPATEPDRLRQRMLRKGYRLISE